MTIKFLAVAVAAGLLAHMAPSAPAEAGWNGSKSKYSSRRAAKRYSGRRAKVRGYRARRGGYSYSANDVANTYGDSRTRYGSMNSYRDPFLDRQTTAGPFDHGFFFDSGVAPRGGDSPYMQ